MDDKIEHAPNDGQLNNSIGLLFSNGTVMNSNGIIISTDAYLNAVTPHSFHLYEDELRTPVYAIDSDEHFKTSSENGLQEANETNNDGDDDEEPSGKYYLLFKFN